MHAVFSKFFMHMECKHGVYALHSSIRWVAGPANMPG